MPLLRAKQAMRTLAAGERVEVRATDAGSVRDFYAFVTLAGHQMLDFTDASGEYTYLIAKGPVTE
jgi:TusA-related sulfurtransferase